MIFIYKWLKKPVFLPHGTSNSVQRSSQPAGDDDADGGDGFAPFAAAWLVLMTMTMTMLLVMTMMMMMMMLVMMLVMMTMMMMWWWYCDCCVSPHAPPSVVHQR